MKWSADSDKKSLADAQAALESVLATVRCSSCVVRVTLSLALPQVKAVPGVRSVQRVVCGGCLDFKVSFSSSRPPSRGICRLEHARVRHAPRFRPHDTLQVIVALSADAFGAWEQSGFAPEQQFLAQVNAIAGVSQVETQTYTLMTM